MENTSMQIHNSEVQIIFKEDLLMKKELTVQLGKYLKFVGQNGLVSAIDNNTDHIGDCILNVDMNKDAVEHVFTSLIKKYGINYGNMQCGATLAPNGVGNQLYLTIPNGARVELIGVYKSQIRKNADGTPAFVYVHGVDGLVADEMVVNQHPKARKSVTRFLVSGSPEPNLNIKANVAGDEICNDLIVPMSGDLNEISIHITKSGEKLTSSLIGYYAYTKKEDNIPNAILREDIATMIRFWTNTHDPRTKAMTPYKRLEQAKRTAKTKGEKRKKEFEEAMKIIKEEKVALIATVEFIHKSFKQLNTYHTKSILFGKQLQSQTKVKVTPNVVNSDFDFAKYEEELLGATTVNPKKYQIVGAGAYSKSVDEMSGKRGPELPTK